MEGANGPERGRERAARTGRQGRGPVWEADSVRALRRHLGMTQREMAQELGTRQQTVSEWETGLYRPRGPSARLLSIVAERAGFEYKVGERQKETGKEQEETGWCRP